MQTCGRAPEVISVAARINLPFDLGRKTSPGLTLIRSQKVSYQISFWPRFSDAFCHADHESVVAVRGGRLGGFEIFDWRCDFPAFFIQTTVAKNMSSQNHFYLALFERDFNCASTDVISVRGGDFLGFEICRSNLTDLARISNFAELNRAKEFEFVQSKCVYVIQHPQITLNFVSHELWMLLACSLLESKSLDFWHGATQRSRQAISFKFFDGLGLKAS